MTNRNESALDRLFDNMETKPLQTIVLMWLVGGIVSLIGLVIAILVIVGVLNLVGVL